MMTSKLIDDGLELLDHLAARVTASALTGLGCGAAFATYKGFPIPKTAMSASLSCALVSTACFTCERVAHEVITQASKQLDTTDDNTDKKITPLNSNVLYASHALGGCFGGGVAGFLFQGNPFAGAFLMAPLMLCVAKVELEVEEYKAQRLSQYMKNDNDT